MLREMLKNSLAAEGYNVLTVSDGVEAVKSYNQFHRDISLVITDLGLPKLDGSRIFDEFRKINPNVKVLISSGFIDPGVKLGFLKAGAKGFIQKPYKLLDILKRVRETLDGE